MILSGAENFLYFSLLIHPDESTRKNIENFRRQIKSLGFSYDWDREVSTCDPEYYKWTQWWFLFLYKQGLAYKKKAPVNWCDDCKTVLANEQVVDEKCERCKNEVVQKKLSQWFFKITEFIEDNNENGRITSGLISGLDKIDWPESTKAAQKNWIGKSEGAEVQFLIGEQKISVFTTRPDTLFGATFMVLAPEHPLVGKITSKQQKKVVEKYKEKAKHKSELDRQTEKEKTGVFTGGYAVNPVNNEEIPVWIADYVLMGYGTGAIMAVPAHDERDFEFAQKFDISIKRVIEGGELPFAEEGKMVDCGGFSGLSSKEGKKKIIKWLEEKKIGKKKTTYRLRDWSVSRQRYWGAPIPIIHCPDCGEVPLSEEYLPVELPTDVDFMPTGKSPMVKSKTFHEVECPKCGNEKADRENDTLDTFVCSSWYFFAFAQAPALKKGRNPMKEFRRYSNDWLPVDFYVGGAEHTVLHLLYSRFFTKAAHRGGFINFDEPFQKLRHQGLILAEDGHKMSKSIGNVINPDEIVEKYGADTLRMYEMFMGPFEQAISWSTQATEGMYKFLQKVWRIYNEKELVEVNGKCPVPELQSLLHKSIKKITEDIEGLKFNTAISQMMIFMNQVQKSDIFPRPMAEKFCKLLSPFAPHLAEEIWHEVLGHKETITYEMWPEYDPVKITEDTVVYAVQINGKIRGDFEIDKEADKEAVIAEAKKLEKVVKYLEGGKIKKEIFVPGKIVGFVVLS